VPARIRASGGLPPAEGAPEVQHELVFWSLNNGASLPSKNNSGGRKRRISTIRELGFTKIDRRLSHRWGTGIERTLIKAGVEFPPAGEKGEGVRMKYPKI
jgi:hypothetical protein